MGQGSVCFFAHLSFAVRQPNIQVPFAVEAILSPFDGHCAVFQKSIDYTCVGLIPESLFFSILLCVHTFANMTMFSFL
jgi:hypothetical protein